MEKKQIKIKRPKPKEKDLPKRDRGERRRKFRQVTNRTRSQWVDRWTFYNAGYGRGKKSYCPKCKEICYKVYSKNSKWYCDKCDTETEQIEKDERK